MKNKLLEQVGVFLLMKGFTVKTLTRTCFDIVARRQSQILLIKVLEDANAISREFADEMKRIASYIDACPLIISVKAVGKLQDNVVYSRFGVHTLNLCTMKNSVENRLPFVLRSKAGMTALVLGDKLRRIREKQNFSLKELSKKIGVSRNMIQRYEQGVSKISLNRAGKISKR